MRPTRTTALVFAAVTLAATAASPSPAAAFFFPIGLFLGQPRAMTFHKGPTESMGRGYKTWTGTRSRDEEDSKPRTRSRDEEDSKPRTRSRDEDSKPSKASTRTRSRDEEDSKPSKASTRTSSKEDDGKRSSGSGKGAKSATKAEANANSGHGGRQMQRRWSVEHDEPSASKSSGRASTSVQRAGPSAGENSDTRGASVTGTQSNMGDFDENLGQARVDDLVEQPPK
jgi:hypothetical protein